MKPRLLLYLTADTNPARNAVAATLSWAAEAAGWFFEVYYDAYRLGDHYGGGDPAALPAGVLTGGTMIGAHHYERLYLLLHRFDTVALTAGPAAFGPTLEQLGVPRLAVSGFAETYSRAFEALGAAIPEEAVIIDTQPRRDLVGIDAYLYPEIAGRRALGLEINALQQDDIPQLAQMGVRRLQTLFLGTQGSKKLEGLCSAHSGLAAQDRAAIQMPGPLDTLEPEDDFATLTERVARRWLARCAGGWVLADPTAVSAWLPDAWRERRLAIYSKPQQVVIQRLAAELRQSKTAVLGRQYEDGDFFALSSLGLAFQLIDPCRPPFPVLRLAGYDWSSSEQADGIAGREPDDEQLRAWAREGRVLVSLIFWTGMIRELENLYRVIDVVALSKMKGGLALTVPALEYQPEAPLELLRTPLERGGVFPYLEMLLASCGIGAAIESRMPEGKLADYLQAANQTLERLGVPRAWRPKGWWAVMDPVMLPLPKPKLPITARAQAQAPFLQLRYHSPAAAQAPAIVLPDDAADAAGAPVPSAPAPRLPVTRRLGDWAREHGLRAALAPYRPYEFFAPGPIRKEAIEAVRAAGLSYMFSKAGFGREPAVLYQDATCIALNYTVGHWDGWTPFETINSVGDLRRAERRLLAAKRPGWLVGTLDTCLWAFTGPIWSRAAGLKAIADFVARGGDSGQLINVTPGVVARYARLIHE
ncbi:MAG TPA: hypothetical protein VH599_12060 [Ktedonobacterales bacterium]|jgi:hypothetical protein